MPRRSDQLIEAGGRRTPFQGVSSFIADENKPVYLFKNLVNLEPAVTFGRLQKRKGYADLITGETGLSNMAEFVDKNDGRQIFAKRSTAIRESVYSGGSYGAFAAVSNDERTLLSTVNEIHPVVFERVLRTGAGLNASTDLPMHFAYQDAITRFPNDDPVAIAAGKYLSDQFLDSALTNLVEMSSFPTSFTITKTGSSGPGAGFYVLYFAPVIDGYQLGFSKPGAYATSVVGIELADGESLKQTLKIATANESNEKRITAVDVYVGNPSVWPDAGVMYDSHFLQRIPLDDDGPAVLDLSGTFENANPPTYIDFASNTDWETFSLSNYIISFTSGSDYEYRLSTRSTPGGGVTRFTLAEAVAAALQNTTVQCKIFPRWYDDGTGHLFPFVYDKDYFTLGSGMFERLNVPDGDIGRDDLRYKYACEANRRYFIFGTNDRKGYYSKEGNPDVIPSLNFIRNRRPETGCASVGRDVLIFSKLYTDRITVLSDSNIEKDESFLEVGCTNHDSIIKISDDEIAWMSYKGPYELKLRQSRFIGQDISEWWEETLTDAEKEACVGAYNYRKDQIWWFFPTYSDTNYPNGIIFVYDRHAKRMGYDHVWYYFKSDHAALAACVNDDGHLLTNNATDLVDWNNDTPTETVETILKLLLLQGPNRSQRLRTYAKWLFVDGTFGDTISANIYLNGSSTPVALSFDADYEAFIRYLAESFEMELTSPDIL